MGSTLFQGPPVVCFHSFCTPMCGFGGVGQAHTSGHNPKCPLVAFYRGLGLGVHPWCLPMVGTTMEGGRWVVPTMGWHHGCHGATPRHQRSVGGSWGPLVPPVGGNPFWLFPPLHTTHTTGCLALHRTPHKGLGGGHVAPQPPHRVCGCWGCMGGHRLAATHIVRHPFTNCSEFRTFTVQGLSGAARCRLRGNAEARRREAAGFP